MPDLVSPCSSRHLRTIVIQGVLRSWYAQWSGEGKAHWGDPNQIDNLIDMIPCATICWDWVGPPIS